MASYGSGGMLAVPVDELDERWIHNLFTTCHIQPLNHSFQMEHYSRDFSPACVPDN
jgi:hypothetical protein